MYWHELHGNTGMDRQHGGFKVRVTGPNCSDNKHFHTASEESPVVPSIPATLCVEYINPEEERQALCTSACTPCRPVYLKASSKGDCRCGDVGDVGQ